MAECFNVAFGAMGMFTREGCCQIYADGSKGSREGYVNGFCVAVHGGDFVTVRIIDCCDDGVDSFENVADDRYVARLFVNDDYFVGESAWRWGGKLLRVEGQGLADFGCWC